MANEASFGENYFAVAFFGDSSNVTAKWSYLMQINKNMENKADGSFILKSAENKSILWGKSRGICAERN